MFAALMVVRLRETVSEVEGLSDKAGWISDDGVAATELPLAKATEKVLSSMHDVLLKTKIQKDAELERYNAKTGGRAEEDEKRYKLAVAKASEIRLVRNLHYLKNPSAKFTAETL